MQNRKFIYSIVGILTIFLLVLFFVISSEQSKKLSIIFFDVGQGDSILISQGNNQILIDGGKDGKLLLEKMGKYVPFWDRTIETVIETHPDQDHIGGLIDLFRTYEIETVLKTNMLSDSLTFKKLEEEIIKNGSKIIEAKNGDEIRFSNEANVELLFPLESISNVNEKETNSASVVLKLSFGKNSFLFTGDLPSEQEQELLSNNINLKSDFLKVGHHGSKYSSSNEFLDAVEPLDAIISVGKNNSYGHPNSVILNKLSERKINILRTDEKGDVIYECQNPNDKCQIVLK